MLASIDHAPDQGTERHLQQLIGIGPNHIQGEDVRHTSNKQYFWSARLSVRYVECQRLSRRRSSSGVAGFIATIQPVLQRCYLAEPKQMRSVVIANERASSQISP